MSPARVKSSLELSGTALIEQSVLLVARAPLLAKAFYLWGALPFGYALAAFFVGAAFLRNSPERLGSYSLFLAAAYLWKCYWDGRFARILYEELGAAAGPSRLLEPALHSMAWQPWALILIPLSLLALIPFPGAIFFFRHLGLLGETGALRPIRDSFELAQRWTRQLWVFLLLFCLCGLLLFLNLVLLALILPSLVEGVLGIQSMMARLGPALVSGLTLSLVALITWLVLDPVLTAAAALRTFRARAESSGVDLAAALQRLSLALVFLAGGVTPLTAAENAVTAEEISRSAREVLQQEEYAWRSAKAEPVQAVSWLRAAGRMIDRAIQWVRGVMEALFPDPSRLPLPKGPEPPRAGDGVLWWMAAFAGLLLVMLAAILFARRPQRKERAVAQNLSPKPALDLNQEDVGPERLEESEWLSLAEQLIASGDHRLATRALYLASLRYLSERKFVTLNHWKSGMDYQRELVYRGNGVPLLVDEFSGTRSEFERIWYGRQPGSAESVRTLAARLAAMRRYAEA